MRQRRGAAKGRFFEGRMFAIGSLFLAVDDPRLREVVGRDLDRHLVALQDPDVSHPHLPTQVGDHLHLVTERDPKGKIWKELFNDPLLLNGVFFWHERALDFLRSAFTVNAHLRRPAKNLFNN